MIEEEEEEEEEEKIFENRLWLIMERGYAAFIVVFERDANKVLMDVWE